MFDSRMPNEGMNLLPTSDPDEARGTRTMASDVERSVQPAIQLGEKSKKDSIYATSVLAVLAVIAVCCVYLQPWKRLQGDMNTSPYMAFQDKELQCHEGCRQHDMENSNCLQDCLPDKLNCMSSKCSGMSQHSAEYSSCALDCHWSMCDEKCSETGLRASLCHNSCAPDMRTLSDDPPCVKKCNLKYDASCMAGCAENTKKCLNTKCVGNTHEEYSTCQEECELNSCGSDCQEANKAFAACTAHCYPANPSGQAAIFVPPSVQAADKAFLRTSHCKKQCSHSDKRHTLCMHDCGPKITTCMSATCPNALPESELQQSCMKSCEKRFCGDVCLKTFEEAKHCYKEICNPEHASACNKRCHARHDDGCMKTCSKNFDTCLSSHCSALLDEEADEQYEECQQMCMKTHCGERCAQKSLELLSCNKQCDNGKESSS